MILFGARAAVATAGRDVLQRRDRARGRVVREADRGQGDGCRGRVDRRVLGVFELTGELVLGVGGCGGGGPAGAGRARLLGVRALDRVWVPRATLGRKITAMSVTTASGTAARNTLAMPMP